MTVNSRWLNITKEFLSRTLKTKGVARTGILGSLDSVSCHLKLTLASVIARVLYSVRHVSSGCFGKCYKLATFLMLGSGHEAV